MDERHEDGRAEIAGYKQRATTTKVRLARDFRRKPTRAEHVLWERLRGRRCEGLKFRRQHVAAGFIVDFYCPGSRLIVEVDGPVHEAQVAEDQFRDNYFAASGFLTLRFSNEQILGNTEAVVAQIGRIALERDGEVVGRLSRRTPQAPPPVAARTSPPP